MALHTAEGRLRPRPPFDFAKTLDFLSWFAPSLGEQQIADGTLTKAFTFDGRPVAIRLRPAGEAPELAYTLFAEAPLDAATIAAAEDRARFFLGLDDDLLPLYALAEGDAAFKPIVERLYGYHQVKFPTPFECACWAVLTQRNTGAASRNMKAALARSFGGAIEVDGVTHRAFPEAEALTQASPGELAALIGHAPKAAFLCSVIEAFSRVDERWLRVAPYDEVERWLLAINGVGPWSASFVLLRGLGRMERAPLEDRKLLAALAQVYGGAPTQADLRRLAARYGAAQGYWAHYVRVSV